MAEVIHKTQLYKITLRTGHTFETTLTVEEFTKTCIEWSRNPAETYMLINGFAILPKDLLMIERSNYLV